ncbi:MAG: hypothetical protein G3M78_04150 [Candidatus Nitrohelix vancouverensis]|uniref:Pentapeptide repeat-containing protein n=1 Tax=Candidatus Nitrohelix vancouverensis TaxID=2705534 RepID=A0A7T0G2R8_9BACT|nr:MAG: hypothetical protein G3M78_04150 [Candidatus Nitrohelix vancouverensis]
MKKLSAEFKFLKRHEPQLHALLVLAANYPKDDPQASLIRLRQFGELLARVWIQKLHVFSENTEPYIDLLDRVREQGKLEPEVYAGLNTLRLEGNKALHFFIGDKESAQSNLKLAKKLARAFDARFGKDGDRLESPFKPEQLAASTAPNEIAEEARAVDKDFSGRNLTSFDFSGKDLRGYDFTGACLFRAKFRNCNLKNVSFRGADLRHADFSDAKNLQSYQLDNAMRDQIKLPDRVQRALDSQKFI